MSDLKVNWDDKTFEIWYKIRPIKGSNIPMEDMLGILGETISKILENVMASNLTAISYTGWTDPEVGTFLIVTGAFNYLLENEVKAAIEGEWLFADDFTATSENVILIP